MTDEPLLRLLFSRLTWPSPLSRDRACAEIGRLLVDLTSGRTVRRFLLDWLAAQQFESVCGSLDSGLDPVHIASVITFNFASQHLRPRQFTAPRHRGNALG
jgi:hypothetical protein